jgi:hypothetical protein
MKIACAHQRDRRGEPLGELFRDGPVGLDGVAEVAPDGAREPDHVAHRHGLVEAQLVAPRLEQGRVALQLGQDRGIEAGRQRVARRQ